MLKALGSYPFTTPPNPNYQYHRPMSTPSGFHYPMYGEDVNYDHGVFDNDKFWGYENYAQFDPGNMLNGLDGVGCMCGEDAATLKDKEMGMRHAGLLLVGAVGGFLLARYLK